MLSAAAAPLDKEGVIGAKGAYLVCISIAGVLASILVDPLPSMDGSFTPPVSKPAAGAFDLSKGPDGEGNLTAGRLFLLPLG